MIEGLLLLAMIVSLIGIICFVVFAVFQFIDGELLGGFIFSIIAIICTTTFVRSGVVINELSTNEKELQNTQIQEYILIDKDGNEFEVNIKER